MPVLRVPGWATIPGLVHGFTGRRGGVSGGHCAELNLSFRVGDAAAAVEANWRRVRETIGAPLAIATVRQVHGAEVVVVDGGGRDLADADAMVTGVARVALGVLTADCVPMLLVAPRRRVVGAVHAGWRGTVAGIAVRAVELMCGTFGVVAGELRVALGPAIGGCCYEVDRHIIDAIDRAWGLPSDAVRVRIATAAEKAMLDLRAANAAQLRGVGVTEVVTVGACTRCARAEYFSHRAGDAGRQLSFIGWQD